MRKIDLISFQVKRFRSLLDVKINFTKNEPTVICGENNIGKTNLLRALNLFFNHKKIDNPFIPEIDIPHHIYFGSRGAGTNTELTGFFKEGKKRFNLKITFRADGDITYKFSTNEEEIDSFLENFEYLFIESHNVNLPFLITTILETDGLLKLDNKRKQQTQPLQKLAEFINLSKTAISDIERGINACFHQLTNFDGILKNKEIKISFAEFDKLRDVVKTMTSITLFDGNGHSIASKGSGAQRAVFLSLMQYISKNSKKFVIWGIDEPEAFLHPRLQKKVAAVLREMCVANNQSVVLTTHSQHFIKLNNLANTFVFKGSIYPRTYQRKPGKEFNQVDTSIFPTNSDAEKAMLIKDQLGITNNDGWEVLPFNLLVEGEEDKKYLETLMQSINLPSINIIFSGGATKIAGLLQYYNIIAKELSYKPEFICIFDNDNAGREQSNKLKPKTYSNISVKIAPLMRHDGMVPKQGLTIDWEIEDFINPEFMLDVINLILKENGYKTLTKKIINDRVSPAHIDKQILQYAEESSSFLNPSKPSLLLNSQGRKIQICQIFCKKYLLNAITLSPVQEDFLKSLVPSFK